MILSFLKGSSTCSRRNSSAPFSRLVGAPELSSRLLLTVSAHPDDVITAGSSE